MKLIQAKWLAVGLLIGSSINYAVAKPISDISNTKHNFSAQVVPAGVTRAAEAKTESQICVFCHTPHGATQAPKAPIWNRKLSKETYVPFSSSSIDATDLGQPGGKSKLCLSCHDGTLALGSVNVLNRQSRIDDPIQVSGTGAQGQIPEGAGETSGFTRRLGTDLTNDHPISFTFDDSQALRDGELFHPTQVTHLKDRNQQEGTGPALPQGDFLPIEDNKVECITCHDPHLSDDTGANIKFLRVNRFQQVEPTDGQFDPKNDIICLGCHDKAGWVGSAHANASVGDEKYEDKAAALREFPRNMQVWQAACLNCHDPHTVQGSRRLLREGTDGPIATDAETGGQFKQGGNPAVEQVCYACHSSPNLANTPQTLQGQGNDGSFEVPDIKTDFTTMARHMPISSADQPAGREVHDIGTASGTQVGKDFVEAPENMGKGNLANRHAECTDCHNPHRVMKNRLFNADNNTPDAAGTHQHEDGVPHNNLASGVLRGIWGVEPVYGSATFGSKPISFTVKKGDPGVGGSTDVSAPNLTREYQLCFKCHSNYTYDTPPLLGSFAGGTPPGTNSMTQYTNQAMEYQSPLGHEGEGTSTSPTGALSGVPSNSCQVLLANGVKVSGYADSDGNCIDYVTDNHRSWHPVVKPTGRTPSVRNASADDWLSPFNAAVGTQTMYCTDCHGSSTAPGTVVPNGGENGFVWGPHGSNDNFLLKGPWDNQTGINQPDGLCFKCHDATQYITKPIDNVTSTVKTSGFSRSSGADTCLSFESRNLHIGHRSGAFAGTFDEKITNFRCSYCHIAVPHGWKNKVFLVNLNDVGLESPLLAGEPAGGGTAGSRQVRNNITNRYYNGPYYNGAVLKVRRFAQSGQWVAENCGSAGAPGNGVTGSNWMFGSTEACSSPP